MNEENCNSSETDELINKIIFGKYKVLKKIGSGAQSTIYSGENIKTKESIAIKAENQKKTEGLLKQEIKVLIELRNHEGIVNIITCGRSGDNLIIIEKLLGKSLDVLYLESSKNFTLLDICKIAIQCLERIEYVHSKGLIHCDIKPENFAIGRKDPDVIYLLDFGLCQDYKNIKTGKHKEFSFTGYMTGTPRYASRNSLRGKQLSRRDDLESFIYMILYFLLKRLPWQGVKAKTLEGRYKKIYIIKKEFNIGEFCKNCPEEISSCVKYIRDLAFKEKPNYEYLRKKFRKILEESKLKINDNFSWIINMKDFEVKKKRSLSESKTKVKEQKKLIHKSILKLNNNIGNSTIKESVVAMTKLKLSNVLSNGSTLNLGESSITVYEEENKGQNNCNNIFKDIKEVEEEIKDEEKSNNNEIEEDEKDGDFENDDIENKDNNNLLSIGANAKHKLEKYGDDEEEKKIELKKQLESIKEVDEEDDDDDIISQKRGGSVHTTKIEINEYNFNLKNQENNDKLKESNSKKEEQKLNKINNNKNELLVNEEKLIEKPEINKNEMKDQIVKNIINENKEIKTKVEHEEEEKNKEKNKEEKVEDKKDKEGKEDKEKNIQNKREEAILNNNNNNKLKNEIKNTYVNNKITSKISNEKNNTIFNNNKINKNNKKITTNDDKIKYSSIGSKDYMKKDNSKVKNKKIKGNIENNQNCFII